MRITVLTHAESEGDREVDIAVTQVAGALRERGHEVTILSIYGDLEKLVAGLTRRPPDLVFNMMEMWAVGVLLCVPARQVADEAAAKWLRSVVFDVGLGDRAEALDPGAVVVQAIRVVDHVAHLVAQIAEDVGGREALDVAGVLGVHRRQLGARQVERDGDRHGVGAGVVGGIGRPFFTPPGAARTARCRSHRRRTRR